MKTIHKFPLSLSTTKIAVPPSGRVLYVGLQGVDIFAWIEYNSSAVKSHVLDVDKYGTGWELPDNPGQYLGTVVERDGFVWHFYGRLLERQ